MAKKFLTDDYIRTRVRPTKGYVIDYDDGPGSVRGYAIRFTPTGSPTFLFCYGIPGAKGAKRRMVLREWRDCRGNKRSSMVQEARNEAEELRKALKGKDRRDPYAEARAAREERERIAAVAEAARKAEEARLTVAQLGALYLDPDEGASLGPDTMRRARRRFTRHVLPQLGERRADEVTKDDVLKSIKPLRKAGKRCEVVHVVSLLSGLFAWGISEKKVSASNDANPAEGILAILDKAGELPEPKERALSKASEYRVFWYITDPTASVAPRTKMHPDVSACLRLILFTGARPSEAAGLKWAEIDMQAAVWHKPKHGEGRSKSKRGDTLPLIAPAMAILRSRVANGSEYVFPSGRPRDDGSAGFLTVHRLATGLRRAMPYVTAQGVEPFTPHDVRRTVATGMNEIGVSSDLVELTLNHALRKLKTTYDKSKQTRVRRRAMTAWADYFAEVMRTGKTIDDWEDEALPQTDNVLQFPAMLGGR